MCNTYFGALHALSYRRSFIFGLFSSDERDGAKRAGRGRTFYLARVFVLSTRRCDAA